jgi:hypothetical protein
MSTEKKGEKLNEPVYSRTGKLLNRPLPEGDLLKTEAPTGNPLWKKKKKINEEDEKNITLNE